MEVYDRWRSNRLNDRYFFYGRSVRRHKILQVRPNSSLLFSFLVNTSLGNFCSGKRTTPCSIGPSPYRKRGWSRTIIKLCSKFFFRLLFFNKFSADFFNDFIEKKRDFMVKIGDYVIEKRKKTEA